MLIWLNHAQQEAGNRRVAEYQMAKVQLTNVVVLDNPTAFFNPFQFEITFECYEDLPNGKLA